MGAQGLRSKTTFGPTPSPDPRPSWSLRLTPTFRSLYPSKCSNLPGRSRPKYPLHIASPEKCGALLLAIIGGAGNLSIAFILPIMGSWYDNEGPAAAFRYVAILPVILTVVFGGLFLYYRRQGGYKAIRLEKASATVKD